MADYMVMGAQAFKDGMPEEEIKTQHPQFRTGWRNAKKVFDATNRPISALRAEKVERPDPDYKWELQWSDITAITAREPWNKLDQVPELKVLANAMRKVVFDRRSEIESFAQAVQMVKTIWEGLLQKGFDECILSPEDLESYGYLPTQYRKD